MGISAESLQNTDISGAYFYNTAGALIRVPSISGGTISNSTAASGTTQGAGTGITSATTIITSASSSNNAITLALLNSAMNIWNATTITLNVYPFTGYAFFVNGVVEGVNAAVTLAPGAHAHIIQTGGTAYTSA